MTKSAAPVQTPSDASVVGHAGIKNLAGADRILRYPRVTKV